MIVTEASWIHVQMLTSGAVLRQVMALARISCSRVVREL